MAPALIEISSQDSVNPESKQVSGVGQYKEAFIGGPKAFKRDVELRGSATQPAAKYPQYLPIWNPEKRKCVWTCLCESVLSRSGYEPLVPFEHVEHGKEADPSFPNLLKTANVTQLTSNIGAEVTGVQLSQLNKEGKDELALFVAQNKVVGKSHHLGAWLSTKQRPDSFPRSGLCRPPNSRGARFWRLFWETPHPSDFWGS